MIKVRRKKPGCWLLMGLLWFCSQKPGFSGQNGTGEAK